MSTTVARLRELLEEYKLAATRTSTEYHESVGRGKGPSSDYFRFACERKDALDVLQAACVNALPALLAVAEAAAVVSSQRNGPYLMADMDATMEAENVLKRALEGLNNNEKEMA